MAGEESFSFMSSWMLFFIISLSVSNKSSVLYILSAHRQSRRTHLGLAPIAKHLSEKWRCGATMLHHCHLPITCLPSPPFAFPPSISVFRHRALTRAHASPNHTSPLQGGAVKGDAVVSQTPSLVGIGAKFMGVYRTFSFVCEDQLLSGKKKKP